MKPGSRFGRTERLTVRLTPTCMAHLEEAARGRRMSLTSVLEDLILSMDAPAAPVFDPRYPIPDDPAVFSPRMQAGYRHTRDTPAPYTVGEGEE